MTRVIGIAVQYDEVFNAPEQDIIFDIIILPGIFTEKTTPRFFHADELHAPRCPDPFHKALLIPSLAAILIGEPQHVNEAADIFSFGLGFNYALKQVV
jgi:hypothetical protein